MKSNKSNAFLTRLRECAKLVGSGHELSRQSAISRQTLENYFTGKSEPKLSNLIKVSEASGVSLEWLMRGEGPMMRGAKGAENKADSPDEGTMVAATVIYGLIHDSAKIMPPERFEKLVIDMWELDHKGSGDLRDEPVKKKLLDILSTIMRPDIPTANSSDEKPE